MPKPPSPNTVLTVDDNASQCYAISRNLEHAGYRALVATSGSETLAVAMKERPDVILLDVNLPDLNGYEICRRLKSDRKTKNISIIFLTSSAQSAYSRSLGLDAGGDAYLFAPVDMKQLLGVIRSAIGISSRRREKTKKSKATPPPKRAS